MAREESQAAGQERVGGLQSQEVDEAAMGAPLNEVEGEEAMGRHQRGHGAGVAHIVWSHACWSRYTWSSGQANAIA